MSDEQRDLPEMGRPVGELGAAFASLVEGAPDSELSALGVLAAARRRPERARRGWVIGVSVAAALAAVTSVTAVVVNAVSQTSESATSALATTATSASAAAAGSAAIAQPNAADSAGVRADQGTAAAGAPPGSPSPERDSAASSASACAASALTPRLVTIVFAQIPGLEGPVPLTTDCVPLPLMGGSFLAIGDESNLPLQVLVFAKDPGICARQTCTTVPGGSAQSRPFGAGGFEVITPTAAGGAIVLDAASTVDLAGTVTGPPMLTMEQLITLGQALAAAL